MKKICRFSLLLLMVLLLAAGSFALGEAQPEAVRIINHRGYNTAAPENTLPAYAMSADMGYGYVETDVCFTKDNVPVLLHDATINRTARNQDGSSVRGRTLISSLTYEEALAYDFGLWKGAQFAGTPIPAFDDFLALCAERGLHPYIELKENGAYSRQQIEMLVGMVRDRGMADGVTWISFNIRYLEWVRDADPAARLGFLNAFWITQRQFAGILRQAENLRTGTNEVFLDLSYIMLAAAPGGTDQCIAQCREAGIPVELWTIDSESVIRSMDPYISGVTTNSVLPARAE